MAAYVWKGWGERGVFKYSSALNHSLGLPELQSPGP